MKRVIVTPNKPKGVGSEYCRACAMPATLTISVSAAASSALDIDLPLCAKHARMLRVGLAREKRRVAEGYPAAFIFPCGDTFDERTSCLLPKGHADAHRAGQRAWS